ncbi:ABC transporter substrate-binding protein [sulfur-oxidizing endosymbiont of Gigantopelta aegis]|uniref:ABC transporter substrate-binding protein n=1 Tax=sulfur-oxidizing endosymbiont of Gigantopelta aegis TaxID=2794934 RepID=UPI0018DCCD51|nr:ABC transporter substrate-binding protein [sulfur-oxidizing endosymbiont of Gigantopelta aegis]
MKSFIRFCLLITFTLILNVAHSETLKVGISTAYPPVAFKHEGKIVGIEADLASHLGEITGMTIKLIDIPWNDLEAALNDGKIDVVMSGVSVTDERKKRVDYADAYMTVGQMVLIKADKIMSLSSKMAMYSAGKRFGVEENTTGQTFVNSEFPGSDIQVFAQIEEGIKALKAEQIDYFVHDAPTIWQYTVMPQTQDRELFGLYEYLTKEPLAWVVKKGNTELLAKLNKALATMKERGLVTRAINRWIPLKIEVGE